jgi:nucleotidyltransferase/DNA polymerase involved in DNA repair
LRAEGRGVAVPVSNRTATIGVATNKLLAKIASDHRKPPRKVAERVWQASM